MEIHIREYQKSDEKDLLVLLVYLQNFQLNFEPNTLAKGEDIGEGFLKLITNEAKESRGKIYVAEYHGKVVAFISGYVEEGLAEIELIEKKYLYISNIAVLLEYQKKGVGNQLILEMENYAKEINVKLILINVLTRNNDTHNFYLKQGFREFEVVLLKEI